MNTGSKPSSPASAASAARAVSLRNGFVFVSIVTEEKNGVGASSCGTVLEVKIPFTLAVTVSVMSYVPKAAKE